MTKSEWSGWVQGVGSVAAILGVFLAATLQERAATKAALKDAGARRHERFKTLEYLAQCCVSALTEVSAHVATRDHVYTAAEQGIPNMLLQLDHLIQRLANPPVYDIPVDALREANIMSGVMEDFALKVRFALDASRSMTADDFTRFFESLDDLKRQIAQSASITAEMELAAAATLAALSS